MPSVYNCLQIFKQNKNPIKKFQKKGSLRTIVCQLLCYVLDLAIF